MNRILKFALVGSSLAVAGAAMAGEGWTTSWGEAVAMSKKTGKPILADFTGSDWCGWCIKLDKEVFSTPAFKAWAKQRVILLTLDFPQKKPQSMTLKAQNANLQQKYNIQGYPTILFLDAKGTKLGEYGYDEGGPMNWTKKADAIIKRAKAGK